MIISSQSLQEVKVKLSLSARPIKYWLISYRNQLWSCRGYKNITLKKTLPKWSSHIKLPDAKLLHCQPRCLLPRNMLPEVEVSWRFLVFESRIEYAGGLILPGVFALYTWACVKTCATRRCQHIYWRSYPARGLHCLHVSVKTCATRRCQHCHIFFLKTTSSSNSPLFSSSKTCLALFLGVLTSLYILK